MGQFFDEIPENVLDWIQKQEMFWVATAPLSAKGHVNVSPKGIKGTIHAINKNKFWITILFQAFEGAPRICRLFGEGTFHEYGSEEYARYIPGATRFPGSRAVVIVDVHKVGTSCGYAVPFYQFLAHRTLLLDRFNERERPDAKDPLRVYWIKKNAQSMDGMPAFVEAPSSSDSLMNCWDKERGIYKTLEANRAVKVSTANSTAVQGWINERTTASFILGILVTIIMHNAYTTFF